MPDTEHQNSLQEDMQELQSQLLSQAEKYRVAMNNEADLYKVKNLYQKLKATTRELRLLIIQYEQIINTQMAAYEKANDNI